MYQTDVGVLHLCCPACRSLSGSALTLANCQLLLPVPEWQYLFNTAKTDDAFTIPLQGEAG